MPQLAATRALAESEFAQLVDALSSEPDRGNELIDLLREDHPVYDQRGAAATVRMRGWILIALSRSALNDNALLFVLEELDTGRDAYLVAAAARALRSYANPNAAFAPFVIRAIDNIRYHDEPVTLERYGEYATSTTDSGTTPVRELLATLVWLGPHAREVLREIESWRANRSGFSKKFWNEVDQAFDAVAGIDPLRESNHDTCCCKLPSSLGNTHSWSPGSRNDCEAIESTVFEDHDGATIAFGEFFRGHPSVVVFFYTRCDNPQKCSLTITKLARLQKLLADQGLTEQISTSAITYDPAFDVPERLSGYGRNRGVRLDARHRMLRAIDGVDALRNHFKLGVNFIESLVNRHRIEVYILDVDGRVAASFERIHWNEQEVINRAVELLKEERPPPPPSETGRLVAPSRSSTALPVASTFASLGLAFFPKCPVCWAAYLSVLGLTGLERIPYAPWLQLALIALVLLNVVSVWMRGRATGRMSAFALVAAGAIAILISRAGLGLDGAGPWGVALTLAGSLLSALSREKTTPVLWRRLATRV
ncbi:MAG TPA: SCO family protein [Chthoniobacterales bacterium]|nr:SCO family protein [Chthoniobacterales bacterium]